MKAFTITPNKRNFIWASLIAITAASWAYSLATRLTNLLVAPKPDKVQILLSFFCLTCFLSIFIFFLGVIPTSGKLTKKIILLHLGVISAGLALIFVHYYKPAPFPERHQLVITALQDKNPLSAESRVEIAQISTMTLPDRNLRRISPLNDMDMQGSWQSRDGGYGIYANESLGQTLRWERFFQGGINITFTTGPGCGMVKVDWDDRSAIVDLYSPNEGSRVETFEPALNWRSADLIRKILVAGAFLTDFYGLLVLVFSASSVIHILLLSPPGKIKQPKLLVLSTIVLVLIFLGTNAAFRPVVIDNPEIEAIIHGALEKPTGELSRQDLRMVVQLDASNRNLSNLSGLELLVNLRELTLRDNQIVDLTPISSLRKLVKLDLKNNNVSDLEPIKNLKDLEYLNLAFNTDVQSIEVIGELKNLRQLVLTDIYLGDRVEILERLPQLRHLNIRNTGIHSLEIIGRLHNLEYLNLYANSEITDLSPLRDLEGLRTLILADVAVGSQIDVLAVLKNLEYLNLRNTNTKDISSLAHLTNLEYLNLHSNPQIDSVQPIKNLANLQVLILDGVPVGDEISIIENFPKLRYLNVRNAQIENVEYIGRLMSQGALQDRPEYNILAAIDIRDNPLTNYPGDPFSPIRPYWENITDRRPLALPFHADLAAPEFSKTAGFYEDDIALALTSASADATIHFTLDGSDPDEYSSVYSRPILLTSRNGDADIYSSIEGIAAYWRKPDQPVTKATVVRAIAIHSASGAKSPIVTSTYFIGSHLKEKYNLPIVSLVTDPQNFFDNERGIYVLGSQYKAHAEENLTEDERQLFANYNQRGREWERPLHIEIFEPSGELTIAQNAGVRIHGSGSRRHPQKTLRMYARVEYDYQSVFSHDLFPATPRDVMDQTDDLAYKVFLLRNSGQDWKVTMLRDVFAQRLFEDSKVDTQHSRFVAVFLNGEYWGLYHLQERYDDQYLYNHYRIEPDDAVILRQKAALAHGLESDVSEFVALEKYIKNSDLSDPLVYAEVSSQIDTDNFIDYQIFQTYTGNYDWPHNNQYLWRKRVDENVQTDAYGHDGRWRWMLFDLDFTFGLQTDVHHNMLVHAQSPGWGSFLLNGLLENEEFREQFIIRYCDHLNSTFLPERVISILNDTSSEIRPAMDEFFARWDSDNTLMEQWEREIERMQSFAIQRPEIVMRQLQEQFNLGETSEVTLIADFSMGSITINSISLDFLSGEINQPQEWSGIYFDHLPIEIRAIAKPGYQFSGWEGVAGEDEILRVVLDGDLTLTAKFRPEE